jgi:hypothetical protein
MIEFNHDYSGYHEPNCCKSWRGGQKFFHDLKLSLNDLVRYLDRYISEVKLLLCYLLL